VIGHKAEIWIQGLKVALALLMKRLLDVINSRPSIESTNDYLYASEQRVQAIPYSLCYLVEIPCEDIKTGSQTR
jgi:hypothetical protein